MNKTTLLITGSTGFIGRNLINKVSTFKNFEIVILDRDFKQIFPFMPTKIDWVIHLASKHRAEIESEVFDENIKMNEALVSFLKKNKLVSNILFTSSIQENKDSFYGRSKKDGANYLQAKTNEWGTRFEKVVLPNLFGPYAKPYHTSVVANFCNDIILEKESIVNNVNIKLLYVQEAVSAILKFKSRASFSTTTVYLPELYDTIQKLHTAFRTDPFTIQLKSQFEYQLLSTLSSYYL